MESLKRLQSCLNSWLEGCLEGFESYEIVLEFVVLQFAVIKLKAGLESWEKHCLLDLKSGKHRFFFSKVLKFH